MLLEGECPQTMMSITWGKGSKQLLQRWQVKDVPLLAGFNYGGDWNNGWPERPGVIRGKQKDPKDVMLAASHATQRSQYLSSSTNIRTRARYDLIYLWNDYPGSNRELDSSRLIGDKNSGSEMISVIHLEKKLVRILNVITVVEFYLLLLGCWEKIPDRKNFSGCLSATC